ncbi:FtsX-like permease family protein [Nocardia sp. NPDC004604]|uniref:FtsX-like permease family protein n=1 Tax=Nocardia sp. NPDC004604 TaxID=3157013 RepID=UPI0033B7BA7D
MFAVVWLTGLLRRRAGRLAAAAIGVAVAVAMLGSLGTFLTAAQRSMTARAVDSVAVDWQVQIAQTASQATVLDVLRQSAGVRAALPVGYAHSSGFTNADGDRSTGAGWVLGVPADYFASFPQTRRPLVGADHGVLAMQQTAANTGITPGSAVVIGRAGLASVSVTVDGVIDLRSADALFQTIGASANTQPSAPPDNVLLLDETHWHTVFDPLAAMRPDLVSSQIHVALDHTLPSDPAAAFTEITARAKNVEARAGGGAQVGNNLGAALDAARSDAAYARVLFLFLGLPAAVLAALLSAAVVTADGDRRRREHALLRARGAGTARLTRIAAGEAVLVGVLGSAAGVGTAAVIGATMFGSAGFGATTSTAWTWAGSATALGIGIAVAAVLGPSWHDLRTGTVALGRTALWRPGRVRWRRFGLDIIALAIAAAVYWSTARNGYHLVLAPEGAPAISVSYWAFAAPALLWLGAALFTWRTTEFILGHSSRIIGFLMRPIAGNLSQLVANSLSRQRRPLARAIVLLALTVAFAVSTATFNATYRHQAEIDARLTNGADVTVTEPTTATPASDTAKVIAGVPGVGAVTPLQHRFAYIGNDAQDLYGIDPATINAAARLQDSYFPGSTVTDAIHQLAAHPDAILVSAETVTDYQLRSGDTIQLRLTDPTGGSRTIPFRYAGIVAEFPTAPKDSFFVANAAYVAARTGNDAVGAYLVDTGGRDTRAVADRIRTALGTTATVTDLTGTRAVIGSSLTAVDLNGLTRVELVFGITIAAAAGALVFGLTLTQRRRSFALATAVGAQPRQLRGFVLAEAAVLLTGGLTAGASIGAALTGLLITELSGVFDPPPTTATLPWPYLTALTAAIIAAVLLASTTTIRLARHRPLTVLHDL